MEAAMGAAVAVVVIGANMDRFLTWLAKTSAAVESARSLVHLCSGVLLA